MDVREKLVELLKKAKAKEQYDFLFGDIDTAIDMPYGVEYYADYLIANGVTVQEWISVKDRLPEVGVFVLFSYAKNNRNPTLHAKNTMAVGRYEQKKFLVDGCSVNVTHWMPMPEPPKGE